MDGKSLRMLRRYTWWSVMAGGALAGVAGLLDLTTGRYGLVRSVLLGPAIVLVVVQHTRYMRQAMAGMGRGDRRPWEHLATFAVAVAAWATTAQVAPVSVAWSLLPAAVIAHVAAITRRETRWVLVLGGTAVTVLAGVLFGARDLVGTVIVPIVASLVLVSAILAQLWIWDVVLRLEQARETARALAVAEERLRFAADLHDIQGHHLQAIALKAELAARLVGRDDDAARRQADEVADLARTALRETRDIVQGYRRASLGTEITNAVGVLRAAGIETAVTGDAADVPPPLQPLFGALVREGTTNVLRHSRARRCDVAISVDDGQVSVRLRNDGVHADDGFEPGAGLAGLQERFATVGGRVDVGGLDGDGFELVGRAGPRW